MVAKGRDEAAITVAVLGLAFKPNIDDLRESPALEIAGRISERLLSRILVVEPNITELPFSLVDRANVTLSLLESALSQADLVVLLVAHNEFTGLRNRIGSHQLLVSAVNV